MDDDDRPYDEVLHSQRIDEALRDARTRGLREALGIVVSASYDLSRKENLESVAAKIRARISSLSNVERE